MSALGSEILLPPATIGVVGGGQLGRMFVQAAQRMGYRTAVLTDEPDGPAAQVSHEVVLGRDDDLRTLQRFASKVEAATVEFENVSAPALRWLGSRMPTRPDWKAVRVSQDRLREKAFLRRFGLPTAPWHPVRSEAELAEAAPAVGTPLILKTASSGYDGKGQIRVDNPADAPGAWEALGRVPCVAEGVVRFSCEVSVLVARGPDGETESYPVGLNRHERHILDSTVMPAPVGPIVSREARDLARTVAEALGYVGVLCVEFFLTAEGTLTVNELAPRPHNSGHLTIEAAQCSQFEQQVRALCGLPIGPTTLRTPAAAMVNLLGDLWEAGPPDWSQALRADRGAALHLYGKGAAPVGRKMGHLTVLDPDPDAALRRALASRHAAAGGSRDA
ncbi:5-(carboxyamino)imidazole ribonucleotide synthase [Tautonia plasticadhaerens]|uniref:N5-carboxyaminoimidazole ribonucleotide synthase n=1 Tax=Tautonia plasticadhaerens TaxID=2527974 RepID=A0A518HB17_9BACT|nr:5-(carboxyamino)imidazole ribonucleotide synthase [Tautonia plasticadhaerens]QDV38050.1 N5-carboxyaminoimidazole ribonucleotide synthase [Tautonia plasticadhaerens]